jgi:hypothetical protein
MESLQYIIGGLEIDPNSLEFHEEIDEEYERLSKLYPEILGVPPTSNPFKPKHRFVTQSLDHTVSIFIAPRDKHPEVADLFNLDPQTLV